MGVNETALMFSKAMEVATVLGLSKPERAVLLVLAKHVNHKVGVETGRWESWPSIAIIMLESDYSKNKVDAALRGLEDRNLIIRLKRDREGRYKKRFDVGRIDEVRALYPALAKKCKDDASEKTAIKNARQRSKGDTPGTGVSDQGDTPGTGVGDTPGTGVSDQGDTPGTGVSDQGDTPGTGVGDTPGTGVSDQGDTPGTGVGDTPGTGVGDTPGTGVGDTPGTGVGDTPGTGVHNKKGTRTEQDPTNQSVSSDLQGASPEQPGLVGEVDSGVKDNQPTTGPTAEDIELIESFISSMLLQPFSLNGTHLQFVREGFRNGWTASQLAKLVTNEPPFPLDNPAGHVTNRLKQVLTNGPPVDMGLVGGSLPIAVAVPVFEGHDHPDVPHDPTRHLSEARTTLPGGQCSNRDCVQGMVPPTDENGIVPSVIDEMVPCQVCTPIPIVVPEDPQALRRAS